MELAGVVGMGISQEGIRPDLLKYLFLKGQKVSEQQPEKTTFWVFNRSHKVEDPATASVDRREQAAEAAPNQTTLNWSGGKQTAITDFFYPRLPTSEVHSTRREFAIPLFITPCPSVELAEVPAVFQVQSECVVENYLDITRPMFECQVSKPSSEVSSMETESLPAQIGLNTPSPKVQQAATQKAIDYLKLSRRYSGPTPVKIWKTRSTSDYSNDATLLKNPTQGSDPSSPTLPKIRAEMTPESSLSSSTTELIGISQTEYTKTAEAKRDIEDFWIEKDKERLEVIASKEKTMTEMQRKLDNTVNAFQIASDANHKLQAQIEKRTTYLSQMEEDIDYISHNLNAADMENERLEKDLAHSRRDQKYQFDRAEEALILIMADPSKKSVAKLLEAKTEAESRSISQQRAMESEMDSLKLQLEERCDSVVRLTETLSRVADSDRWKDIKIEMEELKIRANNLPDELQAAWRECEKWKGQYETLWRKQEELLWEQASLEERYRFVKDYDLKAMRELRRDLQNEAATSQRALKGCLKQVFERMVRCSLCLESEGYLPFDRQHRAICDQVLELTNQDYQQALSDYYDEHDIREEFNLKEEDDDYSATVENKSFLFKVAPAADLEEMSKEKTPIFKSFSTSQTAEANTAVSKNPATKKGSEATEAQKETTNSTTLFSTQHPDFNFGGSNSPVSFTGLSSSFPAQVPPPASTGMFSMKKPKSPSVETEESGEKASEKEMPKEKEPKAKVPGDDAFREEKPKVNAPGDDPHGEKKLRETEQKKLPKENSVALNEVPSPSEPNRRQKRAAMKRQQKAAKKAEKEAQNAKAEARRRVQQALMMK